MADEVRQPAPVTGFAGRVVALAAGPAAQHTCAILADGSVQCWGSDSDGQLGDGMTTRDPDRKSAGPVSVRF
jgi:alpha-tubulin suppressor-like RCC1 family protein